MFAGGKNGISATTSLARNGFVFDWTFHRPRPAALREQSDGPSGSSRRRNERNLPTCRWLNLERGTSVVTCKRRGLLDIARRDIRQLGRDNNRRYYRNRCALTNNWSRAWCCTVARSSRYCRIRHDRSCDHFGIGVALVGAAKQSCSPMKTKIDLPLRVSRKRVEPTAGQPMCASPRKRKFPEHYRFRKAPGRPTGFRTLQIS